MMISGREYRDKGVGFGSIRPFLFSLPPPRLVLMMDEVALCVFAVGQVYVCKGQKEW